VWDGTASADDRIFIIYAHASFRRPGGFTLVEIMVVVAIIALLAALAVPNFLRARKRSQATIVLEDLRVMDSALDQYAIETNKATGASVSWTDIQSYLKKSSHIYNSGGTDLFGNTYVGFSVDTVPKLRSTTFVKLSDVAPSDFCRRSIHKRERRPRGELIRKLKLARRARVCLNTAPCPRPRSGRLAARRVAAHARSERGDSRDTRGDGCATDFAAGDPGSSSPRPLSRRWRILPMARGDGGRRSRDRHSRLFPSTRPRAGETAMQKITTRIYTADEGEFYDLDRETARTSRPAAMRSCGALGSIRVASSHPHGCWAERRKSRCGNSAWNTPRRSAR